MNNSGRTKNAARNLIISVVCQFIMIILGFAVRTVFIRLLGKDYLGLNGLFTNILSLLSMADLGIGAAISFALYKPIADNDIEKLKALLGFFKRVYIVIAGVVFVLGCLLVPFLHFFIRLDEEIPHYRLIYFLLLLNTTASYLCVYKSTLLIADQRAYITRLINVIGSVVADALEIVALLIWHSYIAYLLMQLLSTILTNILISYQAGKRYSFLNDSFSPLPKDEIYGIVTDVKAILIYRIAGIILNATDNLLISVLISTSVVGIYSNYTMLTGLAAGIVSLAFEALKGSIGSLTTESDIVMVRKNFKALNFANNWIYCVFSVCLLLLLNDFINIWIGSSFILSRVNVILIVLSVYVPGIMLTIANFRDTTGIYKKTKYVTILAAVLNLILSVLLGRIWGLAGIIGATSIARILTIVLYEPYIVYRDYFHSSSKEFYLTLINSFLAMIVVYFVLYYCTSFIYVDSIFALMIKAVISFTLCNGCLYFIYHNRPEFQYLISKIKSIM